MIRDLCIIHSYESHLAQMRIFWLYGVICHAKIETIQ
jgi:hypothetical protein